MNSKTRANSKTLDHFGLVAGVCKDICLEETINEKIGSSDPRRVVQPSKAVIAMIIAGLGFTTRQA